MALLFTILTSLLGAGINATTFGGVGLVFNMLRDDGGKERKRHELAIEKIQRARKKWNEDGIERLREKNEARAINNVDEAMLEYCRVFAKQMKPLPPEPQLSDFYHLSEEQKNGELLFVTVGTGLATYALYRYFK